MDYVALGKTGLTPSVMGLGCGGHSRLGLSHGKSEAEAIEIVVEAVELGINFFDTAETYGTEEIVGIGLQGVKRDSVIISTKAGVHWNDRRCTGPELHDRVEASLKRLKTDYIDVFHLHGVMFEDYAYAREELVPALLQLKEAGKIRFLGITEAFAPDPGHRTLSQAVQDDCWEVMMVGFNILNQSARQRVLPFTKEKGIGTLCMFAVRRALSNDDALREVIDLLLDQQLISDVDPDNPLEFLIAKDVAYSLQDAAYRFCRWEPGMDLVLSGSGNLQHLRANFESLRRPPLPAEITERLTAIFSGVDTITGN